MNTPNATQPTVRFSRTLRLWVATAAGTAVGVGLGTFGLIGFFSGQISSATGLIPAFLLLAAVAIPITLTLAERGSVVSGGGGAYGLARHSGYVWHSYFTGWILLAGYTVVVSLLAWTAALYLRMLLKLLFAVQLDQLLLAVVVVGALSLNMLIERYWAWETRSRLIVTSIGFFLTVTVLEFFNQTVSISLPELTNPARDTFALSALMTVSLWGLFSILVIRNEIHRPTRTVPRAMALTVLLVTGLGILLSWLVVLAGYSFIDSVMRAMDISEINVSFFGELTLLVYGLSGTVVALLALNHSITSNNDLLVKMTGDGLFPSKLKRTGSHNNTAVLSLISLTLCSIMLVYFVPVNYLMGFGALAFLWATALIHLPDAIQPEPNLPQNRFPKLPFHPLFPWLTIATGLIVSLALPVPVIIIGLIWLGIGGMYYAGYARQHGQVIRNREVIVERDNVADVGRETAYKVLVGVDNPTSAIHLLQAGARLAKARNGMLLVLKVLTLAEHIPVAIRQQKAQKELETLYRYFAEAGLEQAEIKPIIRLAPSVSGGILETVTLEKADLLLLGWKDEAYLETSYERPVLNRVIGLAPCEVVILHGAVPETISRVLVPTAGGPHAAAAVMLAKNLIGEGQTQAPQIELVHCIQAANSGLPESVDGESALQNTLKATRNGQQVITRTIETKTTIKAGILAEAKQSDILLLGASYEDVLRRSFLGELPTAVTEEVGIPAIITKSRDTTRRPRWLHIWWVITDIFPTLSVTRQAAVSQSMQVAAIPTVDFFVLIALAATIAMLGLLQDSAAVIIGAMLVAPLMSPILSMGMSIVQGDLKTLATATEATLKGIVLAIGVGIILTMISPLKAATNEILARTSPNLLDLLVALASGAAAGYAISRKEVAAALPGVAIAAALVPPLCVVGYGIGTSQLAMASGAMLLFSTNLVAIIFAAAIVFLLLGFHPAPGEKGELVRGLKVTLVLLGIITLVLAGSTYVAVTELNRRIRVEAVFNQTVIKRSAEVIELNIARSNNTYVIDAKILNYPQNELSPQQLQKLENDLVAAVAGPVEVKIASIEASIGELEGADQNQQLVNLFNDKMVEYGATTQSVSVQQQNGAFTINAIVISYPDTFVTRTDMLEVQESLSQTMEAPVTIRSTIVPGQQINLQALSPIATPTPEP
jgi:uncharacterized hydrophobic protein (TIGR00271 family)